jgi:hypothetical protein
VALLALCAGHLWLQFRAIERTLPYPHDIDEGYVAGPAARTVVTGTLHPYNFIYGSLPKYLAAVGMAVGFIRGASRHEIREVERLGNAGYPYYDTPSALQGAKQLFALLAIVTLLATGAAAWLTFRKPAAILLAPLALSVTPLFFYHSWTYLNVDIVGACFGVLTLLACLRGFGEPSPFRSAILPGALAGLATGSKYTFAILIAPVLLTIVFSFPRGRRIAAGLIAATAMGLAFLLVVPYSLIDIPLFLNGIAFSAAHYSGGHAGFDAESGLPQLAYYVRHFASDFGIPATALAVAGFAAYAVSDWRRAAVVASFPILLIAMLSAHRVHFTRNVLGLHPILAMFIAYGVVLVHGWAVRRMIRRGWIGPRRQQLASVLTAAVLLAAAVPPWNIRDIVRDRTDSRRLATAWLERRLPAGWTIVIPAQLAFDARALQARGSSVTVVDFRQATNPDQLRGLLSGVQEPAVILVPRWGADERFAGKEVAEALNEVGRHWQVQASFGTNPVLVNYSQPNPWGNPAFSIATLDRRRISD